MERRPVLLLVEDNESHALLTMRALEQVASKCKIVRVSDGEEALDYMYHKGAFTDMASNPLPQLILLDLRLPKIDGLEVLRNVKENEDLKLIPIIVLTSSLAEPDILRAYMFQANSYLTKPLDFDEFRRQLNDFATYWLNWNIYPL